MSNQLVKSLPFAVIGDGSSTTLVLDVRDAWKLASPEVNIPTIPSGVLPEGGNFGSIITSGPTSPTTSVSLQDYLLTLTFSGTLNSGAEYQGAVNLLFQW